MIEKERRKGGGGKGKDESPFLEYSKSEQQKQT